jgi:hypothetical protein
LSLWGNWILDFGFWYEELFHIWKIGSHEEVNFGLLETVCKLWENSWINKTSFVPYLDFFGAKFNNSCFKLLLYVTKISPLAIAATPNMYLWERMCRQYVRSHSGLLLPLDCCCHCANICNLQFAIIATCQKENLQVKIFTTYAVSYMSCVATLAISHTSNKKWLVSIPLTIESLDESIINQIICNQVHISNN